MVWEVGEENVKTTYQYVIELKDRLRETCDLAHKELSKSSRKYKKYYDTRTKDRKFEVNDLVLILLPTDRNKLTMQWKGPYKVVKKVDKYDYRVDVDGKEKTFHANLLKRYHVRSQVQQAEVASVGVMLDQAGVLLL